MTATKKEQAAKFTLATQLQALVKKQVLGRIPTNQAINAIVEFLPDPPEPVVKDNTTSLNAVKANASKKYNKLVIDTDKAIASVENKAKLAVEKAIENADKAFDVYIGKVLAIVKGTEFEKKIQGIK